LKKRWNPDSAWHMASLSRPRVWSCKCEKVGQLDVASVETARQVIPELANRRLRAAV
jgi:hypothetical protein